MTKYAGVKYFMHGFNENWLTEDYIKTQLKEAKDSDIYYYRIPENLKIKKGDFVLVESLNRLTVVHVEDIKDNREDIKYNGPIKTLYAKVDLSFYQKEIDKKNRMKILEAKLDNMYKKVSKLNILRTLAKDNKEMQELLDEYEKLDK